MTNQDLARETRATISVEEAAGALGISRTFAYALIQRGEFPCATLRLGRRVRVPVIGLRRVLGVEPEPPAR